MRYFTRKLEFVSYTLSMIVVRMCPVIEKATNTATSVLHQLSLYHLKDRLAMIWEVATVKSLYKRKNVRELNGKIFESGLRFQDCSQWNCHVNGLTFQSGLRFQTGLSSLRVSCKRALRSWNYSSISKNHTKTINNYKNKWSLNKVWQKVISIQL